MTATLTPIEGQVPKGDAGPTSGTAAPNTRERLVSLDVFRGLTVAGMLLVNDPGTWSAIYPPLEHAPWHGWTPTDLIFPFFLFIVGITTQLSLDARRARGDDEGAVRRQILRRGALIFLFGFLINGFPFFTWSAIDGIAHPSFLERIGDRLLHWRIFGVLQRIGVAYIVSALIASRARVKTQVVVTATLLFAYWLIMTVFVVPGTGLQGALLLDHPETTMAAYWDRTLLDWSRFGLGNHLWVNGVTWDPEGPLSTIGAICTALVGNLAGKWIAQRRPLLEKLSALFACGALGMMVGLIWNWSFPINKNLWTGSYVVFTGGLACVSLSTVMWLVDVQRSRWWTKPFVIYGTNPMVAFVGSAVMARCIYSIFKVTYHNTRMPVQEGIYRALFASWLSPVNASLAFALAFVLFWFGVLTVLYRRNIILKV
ncbi:MAG TPA: heparan-alpha-glucosaminide N-acetyltransferase domain-containing protein [Gemmatimonadaceae bacterium]|nr:heparan-alpha-glucosaminide N-acetyltransferase domain-containing protein [Gemmatimonadaceae bacterium]